MILKVRSAEKYGGWIFYGGVKKVHHWIAHIDEVKHLGCDGRIIADRQIFHHKGMGEKKGEEFEMAVVCIFSQEGEEKEKMIVYNTIAYLLNDEGKTIERI